ncbi:SRPBCC family protein [Nocardia huaxiensis]|uniref:SRPBCC family protein n=1 Tax=Nocardia huaxiensis TaxID=2755382 RepID=A0A7D6VEY0_9NOCA|nr:SRPBCC family protein [Nocardia huaxiensis]QLY33894.1 SRPBCC family protein [Nocardia huaxiensis]UFS99175.1 SRPBCC family protein [Nocardia huaxiensis]
MPSTTVETVISAPREVVYKLFTERDSLNGNLPVQIKLKKPGAGIPSGVGAQYHLGLAGLGVTEETTELVPNERFVYRIVAGAPVKRHVGTVTFADAPGGTKLVYTMESEPSLPVPAKVLELGLKSLINTFISGVRKATK